MLRNLKVGTKLFTILVAPVVVILVLVTVGVRERQATATSAERIEELTLFAATASDLAQQLQAESLWSVNVAASKGTVGVAELDAQRASTDAAVERYRGAVDRVDPATEGGSVAESVRLTEARLGSLPNTRIAVDIAQLPPYAAVDLYTDTVGSILAVNASLVQSATDPELLRGLDTVVALERITEAQGRLASQVTAAARQGTWVNRTGDPCVTFGPECDSYSRAVQAYQDVVQSNRAFDEGGATPDQKRLEHNAQAQSEFPDLAAQAIAQATTNANQVTTSADALTQTGLERLEALAGVDAAINRQVLDTARELSGEASQAVNLYLFGGVGALVVAFGIAVAVARSVTKPLDRLTTAAHRLSNDQLPALVEQLRNPEDDDEAVGEVLQPIPVDSRDELGQLAEAFNTIQTVTVDVAEEQGRLLRKGIGDIFVHLARRNQSLLDRQIEFIDTLERHEEDPDQLENLFKLDHLATRMRRNAESLLVLAGAEPPRRRGRPVPVTDVVRVAIGEVEDFTRIRILALDEVTIAANVAVDLAHLLSELMENATQFSPPEASVEVLGRRDERNGYVVTVTDRGIGMNAEQLAEANAQLARPPLVGLTMSRSLGFIVIGRLAARFGLSVALEPTPKGGTTAVVTLPYTLVELPEDHEPGHDLAAEAFALADETPLPPRRLVQRSRPARPAPSAPPAPVALPAPTALGAPGSDHTAPDAPAVRQPAHASATAVAVPTPGPQPQPATGALPSRRPAALPTEPLGTVPEPAALPSGAAGADTVGADTVGNADREESGLTTAGLARRVPKPQSSTPVDPLEAAATPRPATRSARSPDEVRRVLSRYRSGLDKGRRGNTSRGAESSEADPPSTPEQGPETT